MRNYGYFYWIGVMIPASWIVAVFLVNWLLNGLRLLDVALKATSVYILAIACLIMLGAIVRPLRPNRTETAAFLLVGLVGAGFFLFWIIIGASLVTGMLGG